MTQYETNMIASIIRIRTQTNAGAVIHAYILKLQVPTVSQKHNMQRKRNNQIIILNNDTQSFK